MFIILGVLAFIVVVAFIVWFMCYRAAPKDRSFGSDTSSNLSPRRHDDDDDAVAGGGGGMESYHDVDLENQDSTEWENRESRR